HYFPGKKELFSAVWKRAHDELLEQSNFDRPIPLADQVRQSLIAHLRFYERNAPLVFIANRSEIAADPVIRQPISDDLNSMRQRLLDASGLSGRARDIASAGLAGWFAFIREVALEWLAHRKVSRRDVVDLCMNTLADAIGPAVDITAPPNMQKPP